MVEIAVARPRQRRFDWLAAVLTGNLFPADFYAGDALGSFNSGMRLFSGLMFGIGVGWLLYPWIDYIPTGEYAVEEISQPVLEHQPGSTPPIIIVRC